MNYYRNAHSPEINWGVYNEPGAISDFVKAQRPHKNMKVTPCGVFICAQYLCTLPHPLMPLSPVTVVVTDH